MISTFKAKRIRWAFKAARSPKSWPVYIVLPTTRKAFDRIFSGNSSLYTVPTFQRHNYTARRIVDRMPEWDWRA